MSIYKERPAGPYCIYLLIFPDWTLYVGYCKVDPEKRWRNGKNYRHNPELLQAVKDAGGWQNVRKKILIENVSYKLAMFFEPHFIKAFDCQYPNGYNKDSGGRRGYRHCQDTKDKISAGLKRANLGKPVYQIDSNTGDIIATFPSIKAASEATGINEDSIWKVVHGYRKKAGKFYWKFVE